MACLSAKRQKLSNELGKLVAADERVQFKKEMQEVTQQLKQNLRQDEASQGLHGCNDCHSASRMSALR